MAFGHRVKWAIANRESAQKLRKQFKRIDKNSAEKIIEKIRKITRLGKGRRNGNRDS